MVAIIAFVALLLAAGGSPQVVAAQESETLRTVEIEALNTLSRGEEIEEWRFSGLGVAELDFRSQGSRWVRSRLTLRTELLESEEPSGSDIRLTIPRAYVRARFPLGEEYLFRATFGKSRVTWGDGALYNAGDLVFGASGRRADLFAASSVRDETDWLVTAFFPLGQFSFIEPLVLVPERELATAGAGGENGGAGSTILITEAPSIHRTAVGARVQWQLWNTKMETGYLIRGAEETQELSLSLQGNLMVDLYGGVATTVAAGNDGLDPMEELRITAGLFHQYRYTSSSLLTFRLESLIYPEGSWERLDEAERAALAPGAPRYALSLYPEITWAPVDSLAFFGRAVISVIDASALYIAGGEWSIYPRFTLSAYLALQGGDAGDTYGFDRPGGASFTTSVRYLF